MIDKLIKLSIISGKEIMKVYNNENLYIEHKNDNSPLTKADLASHEFIVNGLNEINNEFNLKYPIISEESECIDFEDRLKWSTYWLVDPLDGTKEFIKRNGEFTTNIALIRDGKPVLGFVFAPVLDILYWGNVDSMEAHKLENASSINTVETSLNGSLFNKNRINVIASRSHLNSETENVIAILTEQFDECNLVNSGSSLKLCRVAEGEADLYPRFAPTMEWDTAAADAVCRAAGCGVYNVETNKLLEYNKTELLNPFFYVTANKEIKEIMESI